MPTMEDILGDVEGPSKIGRKVMVSPCGSEPTSQSVGSGGLDPDAPE